jgi:hypothetical protein
MHADRFQINREKVIHQTIDGEVVMIDLHSGSYFSLLGTGAEIWGAIEKESTAQEIVDALALRYEASPEGLHQAVWELLDRLVREGLISPCEEDGHLPALGQAAGAGRGGRVGFEAPVLERYDDMQDLILLDPVHEVDPEAGWPHLPAEGADDARAP